MIRSIHLVVGCAVALAFSAIAVTLTADDGVKTVQIRDDCDPATFNADPPAGPGLGHICDGNGDTTFGDFVAEIGATHAAEKWRFNPNNTNDTHLMALNRGGELHTFTHVAKFGGGEIPFLNSLSNNPDEVTECIGALGGNTALPPGATKTVDAKIGDHFQCCVHPWMRLTVTR